MKRLLYPILVLLSLLCFSAKAQNIYEQHVKQYISQYKDIAMEEMRLTGVPASITLGQGIIETDAGNSPLAKDANNHFGIKCHDGWNGETYNYDDDKKGECFRKYNSAAESFKDHADFLKTRSRYAGLFQLQTTDYKGWAKGLKACGYATNPKYSEILINTIEANNLQQYDAMAMHGDYAKNDVPKDTAAARTVTTVQQPQDPQTDAIVSEVHDPRGRVLLINDVKVIEVKKGETLQLIASTYDVRMKRLLKYNDLSDKAVAKAGDKIYLQPKRRNGDEAYHTVATGETMFTIAQQHGMQLMQLYFKNRMTPGMEPATGELVYLRSERANPPKLATAPVNNPVAIAEAPADKPVNSNTNDSNGKYYTVQKGDTLYSISKKYNLSVDELKNRNKITGNQISIGDKLQIQ